MKIFVSKHDAYTASDPRQARLWIQICDTHWLFVLNDGTAGVVSWDMMVLGFSSVVWEELNCDVERAIVI